MNYKRAYTLTLALGILLAQTPCAAQGIPFPVKTSREVWLVYFVHGIMSIKPHINAGNFLRFMRDDVENTTYAKSVEIMRQNEHFFKNQAMQGMGIEKIDKHKTIPGNASGALAHILDTLTSHTHGPHIETHYYTYGWSGLLSPSCRYKEAVELYKYIDLEVKNFKARGITPRVRVIGYSHGGNVVLNLGGIRQKENVNKDLVIDEAILLGTPIQSETDYLVNDALFKKVYNIFSAGDRVQKLDFFSFNRFFSQRIFKERPGLTLPKKLIQIQVKITRNTPKSRKSTKKQVNTFNFKNKSVLSGKSHLLRDCSPGHAELWFFGWTPLHYRKSFALNPLPTVAILPLIMRTVAEFEEQLSPLHPIIFDIRPEHGITLIKNTKKDKFYKVTEFIPADLFKKLQDIAHPYKPEGFTLKAYDGHVYQAYIDAHEYYKDEWSLQARRRKCRADKKKQKEALKPAKATKKEAIHTPTIIG